MCFCTATNCSLHQVQDVLLCPRQIPTRHLFLMRNSPECWILKILDCTQQHPYICCKYIMRLKFTRLGILMGKYRMKNKGSADHLYLLLRVEPSFTWNHWWFCPFHWPFMPEESQRQIVATMKRAVLFLAWGCMHLKSVKQLEAICMDIAWHLHRLKGLYNLCPRLFWAPRVQTLWTHSPNLLRTYSKLFCHETVPDFSQSKSRSFISAMMNNVEPLQSLFFFFLAPNSFAIFCIQPRCWVAGMISWKRRQAKPSNLSKS